MTDDPLSVCCQHLAKSQTIIEAKDAEIAKLKEAIIRLADHDATITFIDGDVLVTMDATLTAEEREAIEEAAFVYEWRGKNWCGLENSNPQRCVTIADTLRSLLERLK